MHLSKLILATFIVGILSVQYLNANAAPDNATASDKPVYAQSNGKADLPTPNNTKTLDTNQKRGAFSDFNRKKYARNLDGPLLPDDERFTGLVQPSQEVVLNAPRNGKLMTIDVEEIQTVKEGELLASMDDRIQKVRVAAARLRAKASAEGRRLQFALQEAEILLDRIQTTFDQGAASEWEVRRTQLQRDQAIAAVDREKEAKEQAAEELALEIEALEQLRIRAPFDGVIVRIATEAGASLTDNDQILSMVKLDPLEAQMFLPTQLYGKIKVGQQFVFQGEAPVSKKLMGTLKTIEPIVDSASGTFRCVFTIPNADKSLPAGFSIRLIWPQPEGKTASAE